jgi:hypothetical protein
MGFTGPEKNYYKDTGMMERILTAGPKCNGRYYAITETISSTILPNG